MLSQNKVFSEFYWIISVILTNLKELFEKYNVMEIRRNKDK